MPSRLSSSSSPDSEQRTVETIAQLGERIVPPDRTANSEQLNSLRNSNSESGNPGPPESKKKLAQHFLNYGLILAGNGEADIAQHNALTFSPLASSNADKIGTMDAQEIIAQKMGPGGDGTFVAIAAALRSMNPRFRITTLHIEDLLLQKHHRLTVAGEGYRLLFHRHTLLDKTSKEIIAHDNHQQHGQQENGIEQYGRNDQIGFIQLAT